VGEGPRSSTTAAVHSRAAAEIEALKLRVAALEVIWENRLGAGTLAPNIPPQLVD